MRFFIALLLLLWAYLDDSKRISLRTTSGLLDVSPSTLSEFLATPANWPEIVLSSASVQTLKAKSDVPLEQGESVEEIFGLPPLIPLSVKWICEVNEIKQDMDQRRILSFYSPNGLTMIASDCRMFFTINSCIYSQFSPPQSTVTLDMSYEPLSPLAQIAIPALIADNYVALNILLPRALQKRQLSSHKRENSMIDGSDTYSNSMITYRCIVENDVSQLAVLLSEAFDTISADTKVLQKSISQFEEDLSFRLKQLVLEQRGNYHLMLGAFNDENKCVGFLEMGMQPIPEGIDIIANDTPVLVATIGTIAVSKNYQRQGIARRLMMRAEDEVKLWQAKHQAQSESVWSKTKTSKYEYAFDKIICLVDSANTKAESLYVNKLGYERKGTSNITVRKDGEEGNEDFLMLCKEI